MSLPDQVCSILEARGHLRLDEPVQLAVTLLDRGDAARPRIEALGVPYFPLLTYRDLGIEPVGGGVLTT